MARYSIEWIKPDLHQEAGEYFENEKTMLWLSARGMKSKSNIYSISLENRVELICIGSYELKTIEYLNKNKIDYLWQSKTFFMPDNRTYRPDAYLITENKWIEIKGYIRQSAKEKWDWFHSENTNSELWDQSKLKEIGIL